MRVGVISDTHGLLRPEALALLRNAEHILHAGDIGSPEVVPELARLAPVTAIRGNIDVGDWASAYPETTEVALAGRAVYLLHDLKQLDFEPADRGIGVVVSGHSHRPKVETRDGVLYLNPGSAGPRRFTLPIALATLELDGARVRARVHEIG